MPAAVAEITCAPVALELKRPVVMPRASVGEVGCVSVLDRPVAASVTSTFGTGSPWRSRIVTVTVAALEPLLAGSVFGETCTLDLSASGSLAAAVARKRTGEPWVTEAGAGVP